MSHQFQAYQRARITTASRGEILVLLFEGLVRFTTAARRAVAANQPAEAGVAIERALEVLWHLRDTLRHEVAPELAAQLDGTYAAWISCLMRAQYQRDEATLESVASQMATLLDGWRQAGREPEALSAMEAQR